MLAQLHAERMARQATCEAMHELDGSTAVVIVEQHGAQLGSSLWHSALPLCDWLYSNLRLWGDRSRSRRILELGAGCGTCGIAAAMAPPGGHTVVLTDKAEVCDHLQRNVAANGAAVLAAGSSVHVAPLLWRHALPQSVVWTEWDAVKRHGPFDVIIACECVYELPLLEALIDTIAHGAAEYARAVEAGRARASAEATMDDFCTIVLGFCRRGGSLCPPEAVEEMLLERFEHVCPPSALNRGSGKQPSTSYSDVAHDSFSGTDTSTTLIYQLKLRDTASSASGQSSRCHDKTREAGGST